MNLNSLDLNLLVALDALLSEANVSRAAMRIGLSQPAASHALQRLRDLIGDPLLVRTGARMELTPRAQALRAPLAQALDQVRSLFIADAFDAASSERQFRLMMPDLAVAGDLHGGIRPHHRHGDLDRQRLYRISPATALHRQ
jgi:DNA-binding transcriptional LysR family regulator